MRFHRLVLASCVVSAVALTACGSVPQGEGEAVASSEAAVTIQKSYPRKIYVHMMPWFQAGGQHWSMNARNPDSGVASWYVPMIGEYNSNDGNVIEWQLLTMKYAGIDGVIIDWPGLNGDYDRPQNKANSDAIIARTAQFGMEFAVCYEDQYASGVDAAKADMAYVRDQFFSKSNHIKLSGAPALLVFGPQQFKTADQWNNILSVFGGSKPSFLSLWYNTLAGSNAGGKFAWIDQKGLKSLSDFDQGLDGVTDFKMPAVYPGFNPFYQAGGWPGPTWKVSYGLTQDNTEGGDTMASSFELGKFAGEALQIATWNDYGEGTMIEPSTQGKAGAGFGYRFLTTLQKSVGAVYTDAELKIVKMLYDQRKQYGASKQAELDTASTALANLDVAKACTILGCTAPVHVGGGGATGAGGAPNGGGAPSGGGAPAAGGGAPPAGGGAPPAGGGASNASGGASSAGSAPAGAGSSAAAGKGGAGSAADDGGGMSGIGSCAVRSAGAPAPARSALLFAFGALGLSALRRRRARG